MLFAINSELGRWAKLCWCVLSGSMCNNQDENIPNQWQSIIGKKFQQMFCWTLITSSSWNGVNMTGKIFLQLFKCCRIVSWISGYVWTEWNLLIQWIKRFLPHGLTIGNFTYPHMGASPNSLQQGQEAGPCYFHLMHELPMLHIPIAVLDLNILLCWLYFLLELSTAPQRMWPYNGSRMASLDTQ